MIGGPLLLSLTSQLRDRRLRAPQRRHLTPIQAIALGFAAVICLGAVLLLLPVAQRPGAHITLLDCAFTATSATTLTGLVTVSTADAWTTFGQIVILALIQLGGLGYMTVATVIAMMLGVRIGLRARGAAAEAPGLFGPRAALRTARYVVIGTLALEALGAVALALRFCFHDGCAWGQAGYKGAFYAISAFCNAGFDLEPGLLSLSAPRFHLDGWLLLILSLLIIFGGLGFNVLADVWFFPRTRRLSLHGKVTITTTAVLLVVGMLLFMLFEARNPQTLGGIARPAERLMASWFMSVTPRTAGFSTVDMSQAAPPTLFWTGLLMIIGGSPDSTAGGVKTTTVAVIILAIAALFRRRTDIEVYRRRVSGDMVRLALSLVTVYLLAAFLTILGVSFVEITLRGVPPGPGSTVLFGRIIFEVLSAFATSGLSAGITPGFHAASHLLLMAAMFLGRLGPLAFVYILAGPKRQMLRRLPSEPLVAG